MSRPKLYLFGPPRIERDGEPVEVDTRKALALVAYLAMTHQSHSRDALATLLWPEYDQRSMTSVSRLGDSCAFVAGTRMNSVNRITMKIFLTKRRSPTKQNYMMSNLTTPNSACSDSSQPTNIRLSIILRKR